MTLVVFLLLSLSITNSITFPAYPVGCDNPESSTECQRGLSPLQVLILSGTGAAIVFLCICYVLLIMTMVYRGVREIENRVAQYSIARYRPQQRNNNNNNNNNSNNRRSRRIMVQGILYSVILLVVHLPPFITGFYDLSSGGRPDTDTLYALYISLYTIVPAQGFFNVLVYLIPSFQRTIARQRGNSNTGGGGYISMMGGRLARLRESMRAFIMNSVMKRRNDDHDDERNPFQENEYNVEEEKQKEEEKRDMTTDVKFPVREVPEVQGEMHEDSTMEMNVLLGNNKSNPNDAV